MRQAERRARTLAALLDAARDAFAEGGYDRTSLDAVVAAAGFSKGAVYSHFATKLDLFLAVFSGVLIDARKRLDDTAAAVASPPAAAAAAYFAAPGALRHVRLVTEAWRLARTADAVASQLVAFRSARLSRLGEAAVDAGLPPAEALARADMVAKLIDALMVEEALGSARGA
ncbi:MAG: helix-turn-helix domain-containing protein [Tepidiformaceae bacterium]